MKKPVLFVLLLYVSILSSGQELNYKLDRTSKKYGYTDKTGKWIISPQYDQAFEFGKNNLARVEQEGKFGYIRKNGEIAIPFVYENLGEFDDERPGEIAPACLKGKYGYINSYNKQIIPLQYDYASSFRSGIGYVSQEKKYWFINKKGEPISEHKYDFILYDLAKNSYIVSRENYYGVCNLYGQEIIAANKYTYIQNEDHLPSVFTRNTSFYIVCQDKYYGVCDLNGKEIIPPSKYTSISYWQPMGFNEIKRGRHFFAVHQGKYQGVCDISGKEIIPPTKYTAISCFENNYYQVEIEDKKGICDLFGKEIIPPGKFTYITSNQDEGYYLVQQNIYTGVYDLNGKEIIAPDKYTSISAGMDYYEVSIGSRKGICNLSGKEIIPAKYKYICYDETEKIFQLTSDDNKKGYADKTGYIFIPCLYEIPFGTSFTEDLIVLIQNGKYGYIDKNGKISIPFQYDIASPFSEGLAYVVLNHQSGYIDKNGRIVIQLPYEWGTAFSEGLAAVGNGDCGENYDDRVYGYIDKTGKLVIPLKYKYEPRPFSEGLVPVCKEKSYSYINKNGQQAFPGLYTYALPFSEGLAYVCTDNGKSGFIDKTGKMIIPVQSDDHIESNIYQFSNGLAIVISENTDSQNRKKTYGLIDKKGNYFKSPVYDYIHPFSEKLAYFTQENKCGYFDTSGKEFSLQLNGRSSFNHDITQRILKNYIQVSQTSFSDFAKQYVEDIINKWQKKGDYEKTADWQKRVNEPSRKHKVEELTEEAEQAFLYKAGMIFPEQLNLGPYDPDHEVYLVECERYGQMLLPVPLGKAQDFLLQWNKTQFYPHYFIENDRLAIAELIFTQPDGMAYKYSNEASLNYTTTEINYDFDSIEIVPHSHPSERTKGEQRISTKKMTMAKSDVDQNIPLTETKNKNTFAIIISNENYRLLAPVPMATNDGNIFSEYCHKTLGIPQENIRLYKDATYGILLEAIRDMQELAYTHKGNIRILFYYAGHGIPDDNKRDACLLPVDASGIDSKVCYPLKELYRELGNLNTQNVIVFLDACFSGAKRDGGMLTQSRSVALKAVPATPSGNTIVFSAASDDQTAYPYLEKGHGLFTYFLLKKLQESQGEVTLEELGNYLFEQVQKQARVINRHTQTPSVTPSPSLGTDWGNIRLK